MWTQMAPLNSISIPLPLNCVHSFPVDDVTLADGLSKPRIDSL